MADIEVNLDISKDEFLQWYKGSSQTVSAQSVDGRNVQFPAGILQPYVSRKGVHGNFKIRFDNQNKFKSIVKM